MLINCYQTKFVAIILVLLVYFIRFFVWPIWLFILKNGLKCSAQRALSSHRAVQPTSLQVCDSQKLFWRLILTVWAAVLRGWLLKQQHHPPPPQSSLQHPSPINPPIPTPAHRLGRTGTLQPKTPPPPIVAPPPPPLRSPYAPSIKLKLASLNRS